MSVPVLIVDGYNIIGAWEELQELKRTDLGSAREQLIATLAGYRPWGWERIIVVFDGRTFDWEEVDGVEVVFSGSRETADTLIERLAGGLAAYGWVEVATSDFAEFRAASGLGARVMSAGALKEQLAEKRKSYRRLAPEANKRGLLLKEVLNQAMLENLERLRRS